MFKEALGVVIFFGAAAGGLKGGRLVAGFPPMGEVSG